MTEPEPEHRENDLPTPVVFGDRGRLIHVWQSGDAESWDEELEPDEPPCEPCVAKCGRVSKHSGLATVKDQLTLRPCPKCGPIPLTDHCPRCGTRFLVSDPQNQDVCAYCDSYLRAVGYR